MKEIKKWSVKDVITTVLLSAVLIVIQLLVNMVCMVNDFVSMVLSVGIAAFLCAPVYMLMVSRIGKRFVTLIYMTLLGAIFFLMGNWFLLPYFIVVGFLCEAILWKQGSCDNSNRMTASWTVASFLYNGINLLPIWFFWDTYYDFCDFKRHGAELHRVLCALLHRIRMDCLYPAVYHADGLFRLHARQASDSQTF